MVQQQSFQQASSKGQLYLVPTPIGNLEDMTFRAVRILKEANVIAAEDTRQTKKLCNYFEIDTPLISYHEHNKEVSGQKLKERILNGDTIALVSDAGTPAISDPGYELVVSCIEAEIAVIPLPGANAALTALIASGLPTDQFYFYGFLPRQKKEKKEVLEELKNIRSSLIFYEAPHRVKETLKEVEALFGNRNMVTARELTKKYEEFIRGSISDVRSWFQENDPRGEFCFIVEGASELEIKSEEVWWESFTLKDHVNYYCEEEGLNPKDAIKKAAKDRNLPKREVYQAYHVE
ncbi:16S rRNA (cytidine(1402)-2'-O)-methyltransferase [Bacillus taeanensis]|uniref:Ribosomal RNA small subunit methyltransferase I n=1 Tax=Bacillus taeanensis TaxID=273032 RepID=A0A366XP30_9BACI|nr:16S rRNA (cytidine(1402)-2'-O)-methyltransferase [Bacillus taeanensis]RBW67667.1 16S rRNA (cytidine(1402)-2'-O)-methyltransferase [Bacillus taeanensis]